jgi:cell division protein FtsI/penicillin-binding protein 2
MPDPQVLEQHYQNFIKNLTDYLPDGIVSVDIRLVEQLGLLKIEDLEKDTQDPLSHYFHVLETSDKITLYNDLFSIWIVPNNQDNSSKTFIFIGILQNKLPHLEVAFCTEGVFNTPKYIMKILQHYLNEVQDVEALIASMDKNK